MNSAGEACGADARVRDGWGDVEAIDSDEGEVMLKWFLDLNDGV